jgi:hypothetical protein
MKKVCPEVLTHPLSPWPWRTRRRKENGKICTFSTFSTVLASLFILTGCGQKLRKKNA